MARRRSANPPGKPLHRQPIPTVVRIDNMIFSGAISGMDRTTGETPKDLDTEIANAFANVKASIEQVGGTMDDIAKLTVFMTDRNQRDIVNKHWLKAFPDENDRPVRHTIGGPLGGDFRIQLEFVAVVRSGA